VKGIDYLRGIVRQRKPATGGIVRISDATPLVDPPADYPAPATKPTPAEVTLTIDNRDGAYTTPAEPVPTGFIRTDHTLTEDQAERIRQRFEAVIARVPSRNSNCDCWPQYIYCCCDVRKRRKQQ
jgi:hypothetical protein